MSNLTNGQLFNLVSGNEVTGESTYDIWRSLDGNENKTQAEFIEYMQLGASGLEIDSQLSETSTNPVQNKVVTEKFGQLEATIDNLNNEVDILKGESVGVMKNKLDLNALTAGIYLDIDGSTRENSARYVTDYIAVSEGDIVTPSYEKDGVRVNDMGYNSICLYDSNKNVVSDGDYNQFTFTVPAGVAFVRLTISAYMATASYYPQIELTTDGIPTSYVPFGTVVEEDEGTGATVKLFTAIPTTVHIAVGNEFKIYYKNVLSCFTDRLWLGYTSGITVKRYADYLSITASDIGTLNMSWKVYDESFNVLDSGMIQVIATADKVKTTKALVIGDSTVTQSNAISQKLLDCYYESNSTLTLLGTKGTSPALHEGRAGWTTTKYCTVADDNPFYNNGFDFSYYMTQQGYDSVEVVDIQLGINDIFSMTHETFDASTTLNNLDTMINSILAYDSSIKIILNLISPPNGNGTSFTDAYNTTQIDFVYLVNTIRLSKALIEHFESNNSVTISPNNCVLNATVDINDGVHPNTTGYAKLGQAIYETINGIFEGSESGDNGEDEPITNELWDLSSRTAVVGTAATATATRTMSNSNYYHPCAYTGAWVDDASGLYTVSNIAITEKSLAFQCKKSAYGIFVPLLNLDSSKTYRFTVNPSVAGFRVYRVDYDSTGVYKANEIIVDKTTGVTTYDFVPTEGYQQGICFACLSATINTLCTFNDLSLVEVTE